MENEAVDSVSDDVSPLEQLVARAQASAESQSTNKKNKALLKDMATAIVSLAHLNAAFIGENARLTRELADKPRIIVP